MLEENGKVSQVILTREMLDEWLRMVGEEEYPFNARPDEPIPASSELCAMSGSVSPVVLDEDKL